jgi:YceI-like protein
MVRDGTITIASDPAGCAASLTTGNARRDKSVWSKGFLHVQRYPDVLFVSGRLARNGDRWLLHGKLTVRGTTAPTVLELSSAGADTGGCRFHARAHRPAGVRRRPRAASSAGTSRSSSTSSDTW